MQRLNARVSLLAQIVARSTLRWRSHSRTYQISGRPATGSSGREHTCSKTLSPHDCTPARTIPWICWHCLVSFMTTPPRNLSTRRLGHKRAIAARASCSHRTLGPNVDIRSLPVDLILVLQPVLKDGSDPLPYSVLMPVAQPAETRHAAPAAHLVRQIIPGDPGLKNEDNTR
jgi:hypothetical protein